LSGEETTDQTVAKWQAGLATFDKTAEIQYLTSQVRGVVLWLPSADATYATLLRQLNHHELPG
jgi:hypothetical protein